MTQIIKETYEEVHQIIKESNEEEDDRGKERQYPSSAILLDSARDEYTKERERSQIIDGKAAHFMTAIILVVTVFIPIIPLTDILPFYYSTADCIWKCISAVIISVMLASFVVLILAFKCLYDAYKLQKYMRYNSNNLDDDTLHKEARDYILRAMCANYKELIDYNIEQNNKKADAVTRGLRLCSIGFLLLAVSAMLLRIIIGG